MLTPILPLHHTPAVIAFLPPPFLRQLLELLRVLDVVAGPGVNLTFATRASLRRTSRARSNNPRDGRGFNESATLWDMAGSTGTGGRLKLDLLLLVLLHETLLQKDARLGEWDRPLAALWREEGFVD